MNHIRVPSSSNHDPIYHFIDPSFSSFMIKRMSESRDNGLYLDVTLEIQGQKIRAHKVLLAALSDYFSKMFAGGLLECDSNEIVLQDVDPVPMAQIIEFGYHGEIDITPETVVDLLKTADYLIIDSLRTACCTYLENRLCASNVFQIFMLADSLNVAALVKKAKLFAIENMEDITKHEDFLTIPSSLLLELLSSDHLVFCKDGYLGKISLQEKQVLDAILRFVGYDPERGAELPKLLEHAVRLPVIGREHLVSLLDHELVADSPESVDVVNKALNWTAADKNNCRWSTPRTVSYLKYFLSRKLADTSVLTVEGESEVFDDGELCRKNPFIHVTGMAISVRLWDGRPIIGGLKIHYSSGDVTHYGSQATNEQQLHEFHLEEDERIVKAKVRSGWMVDSMAFHTSHGRAFGPYGGHGGGEHKLGYPHGKSYLAYIKGCIDVSQGETAVRHLELVWGYYDFSTD